MTDAAVERAQHEIDRPPDGYSSKIRYFAQAVLDMRERIDRLKNDGDLCLDTAIAQVTALRTALDKAQVLMNTYEEANSTLDFGPFHRAAEDLDKALEVADLSVTPPAEPELEDADRCPKCGAPLFILWSGVKCSKCKYWYCA